MVDVYATGRHALTLPEVNKLVNKIKGIANHFNWSDKVIYLCSKVGWIFFVILWDDFCEIVG